MNLRVFVSYARADRSALMRFRQEVIRTPNAPSIYWLTDFEELRCGDRLHPRIREMIEEADIAVLLLSPQFRETEYCLKEELPYIGWHKSGGLRPIVLDNYGSCSDLDKLKDEFVFIGIDSPIRVGSKEAVDRKWSEAAAMFVESVRDIAIGRAAAHVVSLKELASQIRAGSVTPFLGPSCSSTQENRSPALRRLRFRLQQLNEALADPSDAGARLYSGAVARSHKVEREESNPSQSVPAVLSEPPVPREFVQMQAAIARLGAAACEVFGAAFGRSYQGLTDARTYAVELSGTAPELRRNLARTMLAAAEVAGTVRDLVDQHPEIQGHNLSAKNIQAKLIALTAAVFGSGPPSQSGKDTLDSWMTPLKEDAPVPAEGRMTLNHLEWIGDLLWHTLRFDAPLFPSSDDLAFQLAMCLEAPHSVARIPLELAATIGSPSLLGKIVGYFNRLVSQAREPDVLPALSQGLGLLLTQQFDRRMFTPEVSGRELRGSAARAVYHQQRADSDGPQPLLLSSNMDSDVDSWLSHRGVSYFVLFPVWCLSLDSGPRSTERAAPRTPATGGRTPAWLLKAFGRHTPEPRFYYVDASVPFKDVVAFVLRDWPSPPTDPPSTWLPGPLIVHLRGAPLQLLPNEQQDFEQIPVAPGARNTLDNVKFEHRILLSSLDSSRALTQQGPPKCLLDLMQGRRILLFLGHTLDEPDGVFGLQADVWLRAGIDRALSAQQDHGCDDRVSVDRRTGDQLRVAVLAKMGVTSLETTLDEVGPELVRIMGEWSWT